MAKFTKKQKEVAAKFDVAKSYTLSEASSIVKETTSVNFDASVDKSQHAFAYIPPHIPPYMGVQTIIFALRNSSTGTLMSTIITPL